MLFQLLKSLLMVLPQSTCYRILRDRLVGVSRFRQTTISHPIKMAMPEKRRKLLSQETKCFVERVLHTRRLHVEATWQMIRQESLEVPKAVSTSEEPPFEPGANRRSWLGYQSKEEETHAQKTHQQMKDRHRRAREYRKAKKLPAKATPESRPSRSSMNVCHNREVNKAGTEVSPVATEEGGENWKTFWDLSHDD